MRPGVRVWSVARESVGGVGFEVVCQIRVSVSCVRFPPKFSQVEREAAGSGSQGAASESAVSRPRVAVGSGAAAVETAADSVVSRSLGCVGGLGWL